MPPLPDAPSSPSNSASSSTSTNDPSNTQSFPFSIANRSVIMDSGYLLVMSLLLSIFINVIYYM